MRLLTWNDQGELSLTADLASDETPPYAILSHTWGADHDEVSFDDLQREPSQYRDKIGYNKIRFCGERARNKDGLDHFWVDTCCIDKANHSELSEAITSMYRWYAEAAKCYAYLSDVSAERASGVDDEQSGLRSGLRSSRWFTRGWTLQELLAPQVVEFFSKEGEYIGTRDTLFSEIHEVTTIPRAALRGAPLTRYPFHERLRWADGRQTKKEEDKAYCLMGICGIFMPIMYGEQNYAFHRLEQKVAKLTSPGDAADIHAGTDVRLAPGRRVQGIRPRMSESLGSSEPLDTSRESPFEKANRKFEEHKRIFNPRENQSDVLAHNLKHQRKPDTCQWIFQLGEYAEWHDSPKGSLLWISGVEGSGKTILMSSVIESLQARYSESDDAFVQFFFCSAGDDATQTTSRILNTVMFDLYQRSRSSHELLERANTLLQKTMPARATGKAGSQERQIDFEKVYSSLIRLLERDVFLVIDAVDECDDDGDNDLLKSLCKVVETANPRLKIIVSSEPRTDIANVFNNNLSVKCETHNESDIRKNVITEMNKFPGWTQSEKQRAVDEIVKKSGGKFSYVQIALDILRKPLVRPYERKIAELPDDLTSSYIASWEQTDPDYVELLKVALMWIIIAVDRVEVTVVMDAFSRAYNPDFEVEEVQEDAELDENLGNLHDRQVRMAGGNFLDVSPSHFLSLRHATVQGFFLQQEAVPTRDNGVQSNDCTKTAEKDKIQCPDWRFTYKMGHVKILKTCVQNLASKAFQKKYLLDDGIPYIVNSRKASLAVELPSDAQAQEDRTRQSSTEAEVSMEQLIVQTIQSNGSHADDFTISSAPEPQHKLDRADEEFDDLEEADDVLYSGSSNKDTLAHTLTSRDCRYELIYWMVHLRKALELWPEEERLGSPDWREIWDSLIKFLLHSSAAFHAWQQLQVFDEKSALYTGRIDTKFSALQAACKLGLTALAKVLIDQGVDVNERTTVTSKWGVRQSPLEIAAMRGNSELMRLLLDHGANPNSFDTDFVAFSLAVYNQPTRECIQMFLDHQGDINFSCEGSDSVMHNFSETGTDPEALRLLLDAGGNINAVDLSSGETPLHRLMKRENPPIELLEVYLLKGAEVNFDDKKSIQPLYQASRKGWLGAARLLIEHGADIHDEDDRGMTALHVAARYGQVDIAELLLQKGSIINKSDHEGRTPLYLACQGGHHGMSKFLIDNLKDRPGREINKPDETGKTPLRMAAAQGNADTIKLLIAKLDAQTAINEKDSAQGQTSVHAAAFRGQEDALEVLLAAGGDVRTRDNKGRTPLQWCGQGWYHKHRDQNEATILHLIDCDEEIASSCPELLFAAAAKGSARVVERLLDAGVDPNAKDEHEWTALLLARQNDQQAIVDILSSRMDIIPTRPTEWSQSGSNVRLSQQRLLATSISSADTMETVVSNHPIPAGQSKYYFEVRMVGGRADKPDDFTAHIVGLTTKPAKLKGLCPGHFNRGAQSWGWHGDDGFIYWSGKKKQYGHNAYGAGDVVGCAVDFDERLIFFTRNGKRFETACTDVRGRLYPAIGVVGNVAMKANFGGDLQAHPFSWTGYAEWIESAGKETVDSPSR